MGIISGLGSFRGLFGDHFRVGDHFGVGIISGAVQMPSRLVTDACQIAAEFVKSKKIQSTSSPFHS